MFSDPHNQWSSNLHGLKAFAAVTNPANPAAPVMRPSATNHCLQIHYCFDDVFNTPLTQIRYRLIYQDDPGIQFDGETNDQGALCHEHVPPGHYDLVFIPEENHKAQHDAQAGRKQLQSTLNDLRLQIQLHEQALIQTIGYRNANDTTWALAVWPEIAQADLVGLQHKLLQKPDIVAKGVFDNICQERLNWLLSDDEWHQLWCAFCDGFDGNDAAELAIHLIAITLVKATSIHSDPIRVHRTVDPLLESLAEQLIHLCDQLRQIKPRRLVRTAVNLPQTIRLKPAPDKPLAINHCASCCHPATTHGGLLAIKADQAVLAGGCIDVTSGELLLTYNDFSLPGPVDISWQRTYRSSNTQVSPLGKGWCHWFQQQLQIHACHVIYQDGEGRLIQLPLPEIGEFSANPCEAVFLYREQQDEFLLKQGDQPICSFKPQPDQENDRPLTFRLTQISDSQGNYWQCHYRGNTAQLSRLTSSWGSSVQLHYNNGNLSAVELMAARQSILLAQYQVNSANQLTQSHSRLAGVNQYQYTDTHISALTQRDREHLRFSQDENKRYTGIKGSCEQGELCIVYLEDAITLVKDSLDNTTSIQLTAFGKPEKIEWNNGHSLQFRYNNNHQLTQFSNELGHRFEYHYNAFGRLTALLDPAGGGFNLYYDQQQRPIGFTDALGKQWQADYDSKGRLAHCHLPGDISWHYLHDHHNRPIQIKQGEQIVQQLAWFADQQLKGKQISHPDGSVTTTYYQYDSLGQLIAQEDNDGSRQYRYDSSGNIITATNSQGFAIDLNYNQKQQLTAYRDNQGGHYQFHYNEAGCLFRWTNQNNEGQRFTYANNPAEHFKGIDLNFPTQLHPHLVKTIGDQQGNSYHLEYDACGHLSWLSRFDSNHNLIEQFVTHRDPVGRLIQLQSSQGVTTNITYNANGAVLEIAGPDTLQQFSYADHGALFSKEAQPQAWLKDNDPASALHPDKQPNRLLAELDSLPKKRGELTAQALTEAFYREQLAEPYDYYRLWQRLKENSYIPFIRHY